VREDGVWYRAELMLNQDASLYLDTRNLRRWARQRLAGKTVLNTFAYTGSLGVAAAAGGASRVVQTDRSRAFLNIAKDSCALNGLPVNKSDFISDDFFSVTSRLRRSGAQFDCVFVDPPFFSATTGGRVDLVGESQRVLNKVRPLVASGGWLAAVNNALFISGAGYLSLLEALCADGYLSIEELLTVPPDCTGFPETIVRSPPVDPAPFNHSTKIAILRVQRKGS
jgi:23S rRNA (cytosine1962-C5)-methyltransferase